MAEDSEGVSGCNIYRADFPSQSWNLSTLIGNLAHMSKDPHNRMIARPAVAGVERRVMVLARRARSIELPK